MDIQGHIIDVWIGKTSKEHPIITIYDPEGKYYSLLPLVSERGVQVIDTTRELIHHREAACDYWMNELAQNEDARLLIYRKSAVPKDKERVYDPFIGMTHPKTAQKSVHEGFVHPLRLPPQGLENGTLSILPCVCIPGSPASAGKEYMFNLPRLCRFFGTAGGDLR